MENWWKKIWWNADLKKISNAIIDENVDIHLVRRYFSNYAWLLVQDVVQRKKETDIWTCAVCYRNLDQEESIICESCIEWHHFNCQSRFVGNVVGIINRFVCYS